MKHPMSEHGAAVMVLNTIFKQVDENWSNLSENLNKILMTSGSAPLRSDFAKFGFTIAITSVNLRAAFDVFEREQAERIFVATLKLFEAQLPTQKHLVAVTNTIRKYIDAYNQGLTAISNPLDNIARHLYYNLGLKNVEQNIGGQRVNAPDPGILMYLSKAMMIFTGKWEAMNDKYEITPQGGSAN